MCVCGEETKGKRRQREERMKDLLPLAYFINKLSNSRPVLNTTPNEPHGDNMMS